MMNVNRLADRPEILLLFLLGQLILGAVLLWGTACILSIGKRLLQAKSGRTRSSFKTVRTQASSTFLPLLLTGILRTILTVLCSILLVVLLILLYILRLPLFMHNAWNMIIIPLTILAALPGVIYFFRTAFYPVVVVCEGMSYRPALKYCTKMSRGQTLSIAFTIIGLSIFTLLPAQIIAGVLGYMAQDLGIGALIAADLASSLLFSLALTLYFFGLIGAYDHFKPKGHVRN